MHNSLAIDRGSPIALTETSDPLTQHGQLTKTGPYAGSLTAFRTGVNMRTRYKHLLPPKSSACRVNLWASSTNRVVETARYFATGLFGLDWTSNVAALHVISNSSDLGADTLTPQDTCLNYRTDIELGHDYGYTQLRKFSGTYLPQIGHRLRRENPNIEFTEREIYSMQEMCGFEVLVGAMSLLTRIGTTSNMREISFTSTELGQATVSGLLWAGFG